MWDGPLDNTYLHAGKGPIIKTPGIKLTDIKQEKEECKKIDDCKGITEDNSKKKQKISLRNTDKTKEGEKQRSWIKK